MLHGEFALLCNPCNFQYLILGWSTVVSGPLNTLYMQVSTCVHFRAQDYPIRFMLRTNWTEIIYGEVIKSAGPTKRQAAVTIIIPPTVRHRGIFSA